MATKATSSSQQPECSDRHVEYRLIYSRQELPRPVTSRAPLPWRHEVSPAFIVLSAVSVGAVRPHHKWDGQMSPTEAGRGGTETCPGQVHQHFSRGRGLKMPRAGHEQGPPEACRAALVRWCFAMMESTRILGARHSGNNATCASQTGLRIPGVPRGKFSIVPFRLVCPRLRPFKWWPNGVPTTARSQNRYRNEPGSDSSTDRADRSVGRVEANNRGARFGHLNARDGSYARQGFWDWSR